MYRPTERYDDVYKGFVENIYNATTLDRNQIIRAALFIAGHTEQFSKIMKPYLKKGVRLPDPVWAALISGTGEIAQLGQRGSSPPAPRKAKYISGAIIQTAYLLFGFSS